MGIRPSYHVEFVDYAVPDLMQTPRVFESSAQNPGLFFQFFSERSRMSGGSEKVVEDFVISDDPLYRGRVFELPHLRKQPITVFFSEFSESRRLQRQEESRKEYRDEQRSCEKCVFVHMAHGIRAFRFRKIFPSFFLQSFGFPEYTDPAFSSLSMTYSRDPAPSKKPISDPDKLLAYAAWYYGKYAPPISKLRQKLFDKSGGDSRLVDDILERFSSYVDDSRNLESRISFAARSGKTVRKTADSLIRKGFAKDEVRFVLSNEDAFSDWSVRSAAIIRRMRVLSQKGKSRSVAISTLRMEFPELRERIEELFHDSYPTDSDILSSIHGLPDSVPSDPILRKKAFDRLQRMGFRYSDLEKFFSD